MPVASYFPQQRYGSRTGNQLLHHLVIEGNCISQMEDWVGSCRRKGQSVFYLLDGNHVNGKNLMAFSSQTVSAWVNWSLLKLMISPIPSFQKHCPCSIFPTSFFDFSGQKVILDVKIWAVFTVLLSCLSYRSLGTEMGKISDGPWHTVWERQNCSK